MITVCFIIPVNMLDPIQKWFWLCWLWWPVMAIMASVQPELGQVVFRFRFIIHQVLQQGKCLKSGKHTNISKQQHWHTSASIVRGIRPPASLKQHTHTHTHTHTPCIVYTRSDFLHPIQLRSSKEGPDHTVHKKNWPRSDLDGLVRLWQTHLLQAHRAWFCQNATSPLPVSCFQTRLRSFADNPDHTVQNQPGSDLVLAHCVRI